MDAERFRILRQAQDAVFSLIRSLRMLRAVDAARDEPALPLRCPGRVVKLDEPTLRVGIARQQQEAETVNRQSVLHADTRMTLKDRTAKIGRRRIEIVAAMTSNDLRRQFGGVVDGLESVNVAGEHERNGLEGAQVAGCGDHCNVAADGNAERTADRRPDWSMRCQPEIR